MKPQQLLVAAILAGFLAFGIVLGCSQDAPTRAGIQQGETLADDFDTQKKKKKAKRKKAAMRVFQSVLRGENHIPPVETEADGRAHVTVRGSTLNYSISGHGLAEVFASHLHMAPSGVNGPVVLTLMLSDQGMSVAKGTAGSSDLVGPLEGMTIADLVDAIDAGNIYVNVHTSLSLSGEIRGQLNEVGNNSSRKKKKVKKK